MNEEDPKDSYVAISFEAVYMLVNVINWQYCSFGNTNQNIDQILHCCIHHQMYHQNSLQKKSEKGIFALAELNNCEFVGTINNKSCSCAKKICA